MKSGLRINKNKKSRWRNGSNVVWILQVGSMVRLSSIHKKRERVFNMERL